MRESFDTEILTELVCAHVDADPASLRFTPISTGKHNTSYWVDGDQSRWVLRIAPPDDAGFLFYERRMTTTHGVKLIAVDGVFPSAENVRTRRYPYVTEVYVVTRSDLPPGHPAACLRDWLLSPTGQLFEPNPMRAITIRPKRDVLTIGGGTGLDLRTRNGQRVHPRGWRNGNACVPTAEYHEPERKSHSGSQNNEGPTSTTPRARYLRVAY